MGKSVEHLFVHNLGRVSYGVAHTLQQQLVEARLKNEIGDTLLLLEHEPVITLGRSAKRDHILLSSEQLEALGVELHETGRGGDVTYHGPGQLVAYPIISLSPDRQDVRKYVHSLEETMLHVIATYGIKGNRIDRCQGAWVEDRKIGAVGVRIRQWVTMHGFALNITTNLHDFSMIIPCGIRHHGVTSIAQELGRQVNFSEVVERTAQSFASLYEATFEWSDQLPVLTVEEV